MKSIVGAAITHIGAALPLPVRSALFRIAATTAGDTAQFRNGHPTMFGSIANLKVGGFAPSYILDIGANKGAWTTQVARIFPASKILMIEAQPTMREALGKASSQLHGRAEFEITLLGAEPRDKVDFYLLGTGSSVLEEATTYKKDVVAMQMQTLDELVARRDLGTRCFMKLDVQGYEVEVLRGAKATLAKTEVVLMEVALLEYNAGAPLINQVLSFMEEQGFVPFDFCSQMRRYSDNALFQTDIIFARKTSDLRARRKFWKNEP
jgi:FkbM family methyltransferase